MDGKCSKPMFSLVDGKDLMILNKELSFQFDGILYFIPKGFTFDGASIPQLFWSVIGSPFDEDFREPACIHDWCYITKCLKYHDANMIFRRQLIKQKVSVWKYNAMWSAVALGGFIAYNSVDKKELRQIKELVRYRDDKDVIEYQIKAKYYRSLK